MVDLNFYPLMILDNKDIVDPASATVEELKTLSTTFYPTFISEDRYMDNYGKLYDMEGELIHTFPDHNRVGFIPTETSKGEWKKKEYVVYGGDGRFYLYPLSPPYLQRTIKGYFNSITDYFLVYSKIENYIYTFLDMRNNKEITFQLDLDDTGDINEITFTSLGQDKFICIIRYAPDNSMSTMLIVNIKTGQSEMIYESESYQYRDVMRHQGEFVLIFEDAILYQTRDKTFYGLAYKDDIIHKGYYFKTRFAFTESIDQDILYVIYKGDKELVIHKKDLVIFWNYQTEQITRKLKIKGTQFNIIGNKIKAYNGNSTSIYDLQGNKLLTFSSFDNFDLIHYRIKEKQDQLIADFQTLTKNRISKNLASIVLRFL